MTDFRDRFELQLIEAMGRGHVELPAPRRRRPSRRGLISVAVAFAAAATTLAATHPWSPAVGTKRFHEPPVSISRSAPPARELALLGVLRRPQTAADRGPATRTALRFVGPKGNRGVRLDYVRALGGGAATLIPVRTARLTTPAVPDALCVFYADPAASGGARFCWSLGDLVAGRARGEIGTHLFGLVPDVVATVKVTFDDGTTASVPAADNFFDLSAPRPVRKIAWLDALGMPAGPPARR
jgi:hypothetical protein